MSGLYSSNQIVALCVHEGHCEAELVQKAAFFGIHGSGFSALPYGSVVSLSHTGLTQAPRRYLVGNASRCNACSDKRG
jgi:hypothetical protein